MFLLQRRELVSNIAETNSALDKLAVLPLQISCTGLLELIGDLAQAVIKQFAPSLDREPPPAHERQILANPPGDSPGKRLIASDPMDAQQRPYGRQVGDLTIYPSYLA